MTAKELGCKTTISVPHKQIEKLIDQALNETLSEIYEALDITSGDVHPTLTVAWDMHVHDLAHIIENLIVYNSLDRLGQIEFTE